VCIDSTKKKRTRLVRCHCCGHKNFFLREEKETPHKKRGEPKRSGRRLVGLRRVFVKRNARTINEQFTGKNVAVRKL